MRNPIRRLFRDYLDRTAAPRTERTTAPQVATAVSALAAVASLTVDTLNRLIAQLLGAPPATAPLFFTLLAALWARWVIGAVDINPSALAGIRTHIPAVQKTYHFPQFMRTCAKVLLVISAIAAGHHLNDLVKQLEPLSTRIGGRLVYATGKPLTDAGVRIINCNGKDITIRALPTDSDGRYVVMTRERTNRSAVLAVTPVGCPEDQLSLTRDHEVPLKSLGALIDVEVAFQHTISPCTPAKD